MMASSDNQAPSINIARKKSFFYMLRKRGKPTYRFLAMISLFMIEGYNFLINQ